MTGVPQVGDLMEVTYGIVDKALIGKVLPVTRVVLTPGGYAIWLKGSQGSWWWRNNTEHSEGIRRPNTLIDIMPDVRDYLDMVATYDQR